jgi:hypothetical protein
MTPMMAIVIVALAAADAPAAATAPPPTDPPAAKAAPVDDDGKILCEMESEAGTLFKKKVCVTKAEWRKRRQRDRDTATDALEPRTAASSVHTE